MDNEENEAQQEGRQAGHIRRDIFSENREMEPEIWDTQASVFQAKEKAREKIDAVQNQVLSERRE